MGRALLCAQCNSKHDKIAGDCESEPPPPSTCYGSTDSQRYCVTIREINVAGNKQRAYILLLQQTKSLHDKNIHGCGI